MEGNKNKHIFSKYCMLSVAVMTAFFIFTLLLATPVKAITISQTNLELVARPGETIEQLVQLYDESYTGATVYPVVYNFTADPESEGSALILTDPKDLKPDHAWVKWSPTQLTAEDAGEEEEVTEDEEQTVPDDLGQVETPITLPVEGTLADFPYWIEIPKDAEPGTHLISLVFQLKPAEQIDTEGAAIYIGSNVATNIFLKVLGVTIDDIEVDFQSGIFTNKSDNITVKERKKSFQQKSFFLKPPVDFLVTVNNKGNTHQKPDGKIKIVNDLFGSRTEEILVNQENRIILPGTDRTFEVSSFGQGFMFGKYRAKIVLLYGDPLRPVEKEISFWIVPLVEILVAQAIILLIIITIIVVRKIRKKKREQKEKEKEEKMRQQIVDELKGKKQPPVVKSEKTEQVQEKGQKQEAQMEWKKLKKGKNSQKKKKQ